MKTKLLSMLFIALLVISCGKKEDKDPLENNPDLTFSTMSNTRKELLNAGIAIICYEDLNETIYECDLDQNYFSDFVRNSNLETEEEVLAYYNRTISLLEAYRHQSSLIIKQCADKYIVNCDKIYHGNLTGVEYFSRIIITVDSILEYFKEMASL